MNRGKGSFMRNSTRRQHGYTIVEVLIFLAVSALLFVSTMALLSGRQARAQFTNAVRDFETKLVDISNDVSNGYYQAPANITCSAGGGSVSVSAGNNQGKNADCIMLGRVVKLGYAGADGSERYGVYTLVGNRKGAAGKDAASLSDAHPKLLWADDASIDSSLEERLNFGYGATIECIERSDHCTPGALGNAAIAFITEPTGEVQESSTGGAITTNLYVYPSHKTDDDTGKLKTDLNSLPTKLGANETLTICIKSGSTDQYALLKFRGGRVSSEIREGASCN